MARFSSEEFSTSYWNAKVLSKFEIRNPKPEIPFFGFVYEISVSQTLETLQLVFEYSDHEATRLIHRRDAGR